MRSYTYAVALLDVLCKYLSTCIPAASVLVFVDRGSDVFNSFLLILLPLLFVHRSWVHAFGLTSLGCCWA